jgi:flagellar protein FliO/FliZ
MTGVLVLVLGAAFAAAAIVAVAFIVRRTMRGGPGLTTLFAAKSPKRLDIVEQAVVDAKRRLVLVRRDDVEHLLMTGGPTDIVIESGIGAPRTTGAPRGAATLPLRSLGQTAGDR